MIGLDCITDHSPAAAFSTAMVIEPRVEIRLYVAGPDVNAPVPNAEPDRVQLPILLQLPRLTDKSDVPLPIPLKVTF